jgi:hypothetical protein
LSNLVQRDFHRFRARAGVRWQLWANALPDVDLDCIRELAVHAQHYVRLASPYQAARQLQIDLIQADETGRRPGVLHGCFHTANLGADRLQPVMIPQASAEQDQVDLFGRWA